MTPESALGRLVNLRDKLLQDRDIFCSNVADDIDDLDDIIRCITREVRGPKKNPPESYYEPDSEDTEAR